MIAFPSCLSLLPPFYWVNNVIFVVPRDHVPRVSGTEDELCIITQFIDPLELKMSHWYILNRRKDRSLSSLERILQFDFRSINVNF